VSYDGFEEKGVKFLTELLPGVEGAAELKMASVLYEGKSESMFVIGTMASLISCRTLSPDEGVPYQVHEIAVGVVL
jgi:hypothetical protein